MSCQCNKLYCHYCGPEQGNYKCPACGKWSADGACESRNDYCVARNDLIEAISRYGAAISEGIGHELDEIYQLASALDETGDIIGISEDKVLDLAIYILNEAPEDPPEETPAPDAAKTKDAAGRTEPVAAGRPEKAKYIKKPGTPRATTRITKKAGAKQRAAEKRAAARNWAALQPGEAEEERIERVIGDKRYRKLDPLSVLPGETIEQARNRRKYDKRVKSGQTAGGFSTETDLEKIVGQGAGEVEADTGEEAAGAEETDTGEEVVQDLFAAISGAADEDETPELAPAPASLPTTDPANIGPITIKPKLRSVNNPVYYAQVISLPNGQTKLAALLQPGEVIIRAARRMTPAGTQASLASPGFRTAAGPVSAFTSTHKPAKTSLQYRRIEGLVDESQAQELIEAIKAELTKKRAIHDQMYKNMGDLIQAWNADNPRQNLTMPKPGGVVHPSIVAQLLTDTRQSSIGQFKGQAQEALSNMSISLADAPFEVSAFNASGVTVIYTGPKPIKISYAKPIGQRTRMKFGSTESTSLRDLVINANSKLTIQRSSERRRGQQGAITLAVEGKELSGHEIADLASACNFSTFKGSEPEPMTAFKRINADMLKEHEELMAILNDVDAWKNPETSKEAMTRLLSLKQKIGAFFPDAEECLTTQISRLPALYQSRKEEQEYISTMLASLEDTIRVFNKQFPNLIDERLFGGDKALIVAKMLKASIKLCEAYNNLLSQWVGVANDPKIGQQVRAYMTELNDTYNSLIGKRDRYNKVLEDSKKSFRDLVPAVPASTKGKEEDVTELSNITQQIANNATMLEKDEFSPIETTCRECKRSKLYQAPQIPGLLITVCPSCADRQVLADEEFIKPDVREVNKFVSESKTYLMNWISKAKEDADFLSLNMHKFLQSNLEELRAALTIAQSVAASVCSSRVYAPMRVNEYGYNTSQGLSAIRSMTMASPTDEICPTCGGQRKRPGEEFCLPCGGTGKVLQEVEPTEVMVLTRGGTVETRQAKYIGRIDSMTRTLDWDEKIRDWIMRLGCAYDKHIKARVELFKALPKMDYAAEAVESMNWEAKVADLQAELNDRIELQDAVDGKTKPPEVLLDLPETVSEGEYRSFKDEAIKIRHDILSKAVVRRDPTSWSYAELLELYMRPDIKEDHKQELFAALDRLAYQMFAQYSTYYDEWVKSCQDKLSKDTKMTRDDVSILCKVLKDEHRQEEKVSNFHRLASASLSKEFRAETGKIRAKLKKLMDKPPRTAEEIGAEAEKKRAEKDREAGVKMTFWSFADPSNPGRLLTGEEAVKAAMDEAMNEYQQVAEEALKYYTDALKYVVERSEEVTVDATGLPKINVATGEKREKSIDDILVAQQETGWTRPVPYKKWAGGESGEVSSAQRDITKLEGIKTRIQDNLKIKIDVDSQGKPVFDTLAAMQGRFALLKTGKWESEEYPNFTAIDPRAPGKNTYMNCLREIEELHRKINRPGRRTTAQDKEALKYGEPLKPSGRPTERAVRTWKAAIEYLRARAAAALDINGDKMVGLMWILADWDLARQGLAVGNVSKSRGDTFVQTFAKKYDGSVRDMFSISGDVSFTPRTIKTPTRYTKYSPTPDARYGYQRRPTRESVFYDWVSVMVEQVKESQGEAAAVRLQLVSEMARSAPDISYAQVVLCNLPTRDAYMNGLAAVVESCSNDELIVHLRPSARVITNIHPEERKLRVSRDEVIVVDIDDRLLAFANAPLDS